MLSSFKLVQGLKKLFDCFKIAMMQLLGRLLAPAPAFFSKLSEDLSIKKLLKVKIVVSPMWK